MNLWDETLFFIENERPSLHGDVDADVAIIGGGFTGLWSAYHLLDLDPSLRIVICEAEHIGFGAGGAMVDGAQLSIQQRRGMKKFAHTYSPRLMKSVHSLSSMPLKLDSSKAGPSPLHEIKRNLLESLHQHPHTRSTSPKEPSSAILG